MMAEDKTQTDAEELDVEQGIADALGPDDVKGALSENDSEDQVLTTEEANEDDSTEDDAETDESGDDESADDDAGAGDEADETEEADESSEADAADELPVAEDKDGVFETKTAEDPGDFKPGDYSFEVKTTDGKAAKISSLEEADAFAAKLDEDPELLTPSQFVAFSRKVVQMENGIQNDRKDYDTQKEEFDRQASLDKTRDDQLVKWDKEIKYLAAREELPEITPEMDKADWSKPEIAKDPAVKARLELLKWMDSENKNRLEAGLDPISSLIDAHNNMQLEQMKKGEADTKSKDREARQKRGKMVTGRSSFTPMDTPVGSIVGEGGSLNDLMSEFYN